MSNPLSQTAPERAKPNFAVKETSFGLRLHNLLESLSPVEKEELTERLWSGVEVLSASGCWVWTITFVNGYACVYHSNHKLRAHRVAYALVKGDSAVGSVIDHLCRNTVCINPLHLEAVSVRENTRRGISGQARILERAKATHCVHGHMYTPETIRWRQRENGHRTRDCRICLRIKYSAHWQRIKEQRNSARGGGA